MLPRTGLAVAFAGVLAATGWLLVGRRRPGGGLGHPMAAAVALVALAAALAWALALNPALSFAGAYSRYESVVTRLAYLGLFAGGAWLVRGRTARLVADAFVVGSAIAATEAFYQWSVRVPFRPDGNLGQAGLLGVLLAMAVPLALEAGLRYRPWLLTLPVLGAGLLVSTSRAGWLGAVVAVFVLFAFRAASTGRRRLLVGLGLLGAVAAVLVLVASPLRALNSDTGAARLGVWRDAVTVAAARPLTGWGEDATGLVFGRYQSSDWEPGDTFDRIHDQPLDLLVTQGLAGTGAALLMWGLFWVTAWRRAAAGPLGPVLPGLLAAVAGYQCWSLLNFDWAPATGPVFLFAGAAWAGLGSSNPAASGEAGGDGARPPRWAAVPAAVAVAAAALLLGALPVLADRLHYTGANSRAVALDPFQAHYHQALGEQLGRSTPAGLAELKRAYDLGDYDYSFNVELGDAALQAGDRPLARAAYTRADQVYRFDPSARDKLVAMGPG